MITALETVNGDTATVCGEGKCWGPSVTTTSKPPWEPCARWQMLFQVSYADGQYATELARLCTAYGVTGASSANYMVQGWFGKQFRLLFYDQPQLAPDAEWFDFPLTVCLHSKDTLDQGHARQERIAATGLRGAHVDGSLTCLY